MKVYVHYHNKTDEVYISVADNILQSDELFKSKQLKPLDFITTGLVISKETPSSEKRFFTGWLKDQKGNFVLDDFGSLVRYEQWRDVSITLVKKYKFDEPCNLFHTLHDTGPWCEESVNDEIEHFIVYGDHKKMKLQFHIYKQIVSYIYGTNKPKIFEVPGDFGESFFAYRYRQ